MALKLHNQIYVEGNNLLNFTQTASWTVEFLNRFDEGSAGGGYADIYIGEVS